MKSFTKMVAVAGVMFALGASTSLAHADAEAAGSRDAADTCVCVPATASDRATTTRPGSDADSDAHREFLEQVWTAP